MADLQRCVFCGCAAGSFRSTSPGADKLRSWEPALFIDFYWYRSFPLSIPLEILQAKVAVGSTATFCFNLPARILVLVDGVEAVVVLIAFRRFAQFPGNESQRARSGEEKGCG